MFSLSIVNVITSSCLTVSKYSYPQIRNDFPIVKLLSTFKVKRWLQFSFVTCHNVAVTRCEDAVMILYSVQCLYCVRCITPCKPLACPPRAQAASVTASSAQCPDNLQTASMITSPHQVHSEYFTHTRLSLC